MKCQVEKDEYHMISLMESKKKKSSIKRLDVVTWHRRWGLGKDLEKGTNLQLQDKLLGM